MALKSILYEYRESFEQARADAGVGYEDNVLLKDEPRAPRDISSMDIRSLPAFFGHSMAALAIVALRLNLRKLNVLDVGGALGGHFSAAKSTFGASLEFDWTVIETPLFSDYARAYITTPEINYYDSIDSVSQEQFDITYMSSVLPYVADIDSLISSRPVRASPYLFISRTGLGEVEIPFLQTVTYDVGLVRYPGRIISRNKLMGILEKDYDLLTSWEYEQFSVGDRPYTAPSMLWRRKL
jgi:putative methyltransferase (TIGR04325 family)